MRNKDNGTLPMFMPPEGTWRPPLTFPRLDAAKTLCIDVETYDPNLTTHGPGWGRGDGYIVGVAVGTGDGHRWYFPIRHSVGRGNLPPESVLAWCRDQFGRPHQPKVFANSQYDLGWLFEEGVEVQGDIIDAQIAEPLLDEHAYSYSLETLAQKYLGEGKVRNALYQWAHETYGGDIDKQGHNIWRCPPSLVGPYAEGDVDLPLRIWEQQKPMLEAQGLMDVFRMESQLPQILMRMRHRGIRVDLNRVQQVKEALRNKARDASAVVRSLSGVDVNVWASDSIAKAFEALSIPYPRTPTGKPSFTKEWLEHHPAQLAKAVRNVRRFEKASSTFVDGYVVDKQVNGRVHGSFHQLRGDDGGTIVGRFSSCLPPTSQVATEHGIKRLFEIGLGDRVWTHQQQWQPVVNKWYTGNRPVVAVTLKNGYTVQCTSNHRLLTNLGWLSVEDMYEFMQRTVKRPRAFSESRRNLPSRGQADSGRNSASLSGIVPHGAGNTSTRFNERAVRLREKAAVFALKKRGKTSQLGQARRTASQLRRRNGRWARLQNYIEAAVVYWKDKQTRFCTPRSYVSGAGANRNTGRLPRAPHQRRPEQQSFKQFSLSVGSGACGDSPILSDIRTIKYVGVTRVYDLEVAEDHCFLADGVFVHNSSPNLENIPARDPEVGPLVRSIWYPEIDHSWVVYDYSQIQFRIMTHYAVGPGAEEARAKYNADPKTDYHTMVQQLIQETTGIYLERKPVKNINFGLAFTMGVDKLAAEIGISVDEAKPLIEAYHEGIPFVRKTSDMVAQRGQQRGYIKGIMGRRHRYVFWEPRDWKLRGMVALSRDPKRVLEEVRKYHPKATEYDVVRAYTHLGLNRLAQDGEGCTMKKAIVDCHRAGIFDVVGYPLNIVHDDINFSNPRTPEAEEALQEAQRIMTNAIQWKIPILVERSEGPNWGE